MACCWFPTEYNTDAYLIEEMPNVRWWENMSGRHAESQYFTYPATPNRQALSSGFMSGRPDFFPVPDRSNTTDPFAITRDALGRVLFREDGYPRVVRLGNANASFASFDAMSTGYDSDLGGSVWVLFVAIPDAWFQIATPGTCLSVMQVEARLLESFAQPGHFEDFLYESVEALTLENLLDQITELTRTERPAGVRDLQNIYNDLYRCWIDAGMPESEPLSDPPLFYLAEFFSPDITQFGGTYSQVSDVYRALGAQRLRIELAREVQPYTPEGTDPRPSGSHRRLNIHPVYTVYTRRIGWNAAVQANDPGGVHPSPNYLSLLFQAAEPVPELEYEEKSIVARNNAAYGGKLAGTILKINGEVVDVSELDTFSVQSKMTFQNVQDYSPPTAFVQQGESNIPDVQLPQAVLGQPNSRDLVISEFLEDYEAGFMFEVDFDLLMPTVGAMRDRKRLAPWSSIAGLGNYIVSVPDIAEDYDFSAETTQVQISSTNYRGNGDVLLIAGYREAGSGLRNRGAYAVYSGNVSATLQRVSNATAVPTLKPLADSLPEGVHLYIFRGGTATWRFLCAGYKDPLLRQADNFDSSETINNIDATDVWVLNAFAPMVYVTSTRYGFQNQNRGQIGSRTLISSQGKDGTCYTNRSGDSFGSNIYVLS